MSADDELGYVYLPTTSVTNDMYGGQRLGDNLFSVVDRLPRRRDRQARLALPDRASRSVRLRQSGRADPRRHHGRRPADQGARADHQAVVGLRARSRRPASRCGRSSSGRCRRRPCLARRASPTQPFPTKPPAFDRQGITEDDLIDFTPELRAEALEIVKHYVTGPMFTPPSIAGAGPNDKKGTIELPGSVGGADWTGAAFDPETGMLYVPSMTNPFVANLLPGDPKEDEPALSRLDARAGPGPARPAAGEAAVRPHHRDRSESRRAGVDGGERRRSAHSSAAEGAQPAAARSVGARRAARDEDAAVRDRGRSDQRAHAAERRRQEDPRLRQGDRPGACGKPSSRPAAPAR